MKHLGKRDGARLKGFIEIEKVSLKDGTRELYHNTITNGGKQFLLDKSAGLMLGMSADIFGMTACTNTLDKLANSQSTPPAGRSARSDRDITNVMLNLEENVLTGLSGSTSFINIFDDSFSSANKVVGYANSNVVATGDNKEGSIDFSKGEYLVDPFTIAKRWKYSEGIATGTINCIAMMPAGCIKEPSGDGVKFSKCIDQINTQYTNYTSMSDGFLIPGVPGYTANNEILLNFNKDSNSKWKYNIGTGEVSKVPDTDNFFIPKPYTGDIVDMQYIDNYLYVLSLYVHNGTTSIYVRVYDPTNSMNEVGNFTCRGNNSNEYIIKASILKVQNDLYVTAVGDYDATSPAKLWKLNKTGNYATSSGACQTDFSMIGLNVPSGLDIKNVGVGSYNGNYVMYVPVKLYSNVDTNRSRVSGSEFGYKLVGYVFTDLSNPVGTAIDMIPGINPNEILFAAGSTSGTLRVGFDKNNSIGSGFGNNYDLVDSKGIIMNNSSKTNTTSISYDTMQKGVYLTLDKWWTNVISFVKLNSPITKTESDIIYITYGYKIV